MRATQRLAWSLLAVAVVGGRLSAAQHLDRRQIVRIEQALRQEGQAVVALADAVAAGKAARPDFPIAWHNDFLKAQAGTFVPFIVTISGAELKAPAVLLYVRLDSRSRDAGGPRSARRQNAGGGGSPVHAFEEIYPVDLPVASGPARIARGFSVPAGEYELTVVAREREGGEGRDRRRMASVLRQALTVPDYSGRDLMTSTVILADRLTVLRQPPAPGELLERPYAIANRDVHPALDATFRRDEELIVVFLVYNPAVAADEHFDLEVEYHFFRKGGLAGGTAWSSSPDASRPAAQPDETYFNRTEPQRFNPLVVGPQFEPSAGHPVLAGQGVPLWNFQEGDYRLAITVTDLVARRTIRRDVRFTVGS